MIRQFGSVGGITEQPSGLDVGLSGSSLKNKQKGSYTLSSASGTVTISKVDLNKAVLQFYVKPTGAADDFYVTKVGGKLINDTTIQFDIGFYSLNITIYWTVTEYNNVKSVQRGEAINIISDATITINSVNAAKSLIIYSTYFTNNANTGRYVHDYMDFNSNTEIYYYAIANLSYRILRWQVIEFD